jgi:hypothetical protein
VFDGGKVEAERHVHVRVEERRGAPPDRVGGPPHLPDVLEIVARPADHGAIGLEGERPGDGKRQRDVHERRERQLRRSCVGPSDWLGR